MWRLLCLIQGFVGVAQPTLRIAGSSTVYPVANAWKNSQASQYNYILQGGGSSTGAKRVCAPRNDTNHVDIGDMSRDWKSSEAEMLDDGSTFECKNADANGVKVRVTQIQVATDGLAVVTKLNGAAHLCLTSPDMGGLTLAQLRWIFSNWTNSSLQNDPSGGVNIQSVAPNDDGDGIKEWSDLNSGCQQVPINIYGAGDQSGTYDFFGEVVLCKNCFKGKSGYTPEGFPNCNMTEVHHLEAMNSTNAAAYIASNRDKLGPKNCYVPSEDDQKILNWVLADSGGLAYFGFAYYSTFSSLLTVVPIASDRIKGIADTADAKIAPTTYTITDGSYSVFTRLLYMNVDNAAWSLVRTFLEYGFSNAGQALVASVGYVTVNAAVRAKMISNIARGANIQADYNPVPPAGCDPGMELSVQPYINQWGKSKQGYACTPCAPGKAKDDSTTRKCSVCIAGFYAAGNATTCDICNAGTYAAVGSSNCTACPINHIAPQRGAGSCSRCAAGMYADTNGSQFCTRCPLGKFRPRDPWDGLCQTCPPQMTTAFMAAEQLVDCQCSPGYFREDENASCISCRKGMTCPFGSDMSNYRAWHNSGRPEPRPAHLPFPLLDQRHAAVATDPLDVFACKDDKRCPGGPPGTCGRNMKSDVISCGRCRDEWYWDGEECVECTSFEVSSILFPVVPLVFSPIVIFVMYRFFRDDVRDWESWQNGFAAVLFILLNHFQITTLAASSAVQFPSNVGNYFSVWEFTDNALTLFKPRCAGFQDFQKQTAVRTFAPIFGGLMVVWSWGLSRIANCFLSRDVGMNVDRTMNIYFSIVLTFFAGIVSMCMSVFKCHDNPNGKRTLTVDESIICGEGAWNTAVAFAMASCIVYLLGFGALFTWKIVVAPRHFMNVSFQRRWKFLFIKYRPDVWWWSLSFCLKGIVLNVGYTFLDVGIAQINWLMAVCGVYLGSAIYFMPWRNRAANFTDIYVHVALLFQLSWLTWFAHDAIGTDTRRIDQELSYLIIITSLSTVFCSATVLAFYVLQKADVKQCGGGHLAFDNTLLAAQGAFETVAKLDSDAYLSFVKDISELDRCDLVKASHILRVELQGHGHKTRASPRTRVLSQEEQQRMVSSSATSERLSKESTDTVIMTEQVTDVAILVQEEALHESREMKNVDQQTQMNDDMRFLVEQHFSVARSSYLSTPRSISESARIVTTPNGTPRSAREAVLVSPRRVLTPRQRSPRAAIT